LVEKIPHDAPVLVIGLGRFGAATAGELDKLGRDVLAVDEDPALVQKWSDRVKHTAVLDARNMNALEQIGARDFPIAVVATGSSIEASVLITTNLVDMKIPQIWAKAISESHGKILTRIGAHRVIYPEREAGVNKVREAAAREEEAAPAPEEPKGPTELEVLLEIRDSLKK